MGTTVHARVAHALKPGKLQSAGLGDSMAAGRGRQGEDWLIDQNHFGTQTKAFSFASPFKNHWDAYAGETMGGQSCCPRAPLCMAVLPMSKNLGKPLLAGLDGSMAVQWQVSR